MGGGKGLSIKFSVSCAPARSWSATYSTIWDSETGFNFWSGTAWCSGHMWKCNIANRFGRCVHFDIWALRERFVCLGVRSWTPPHPPGLRRSGYGPTFRVSSSDVRISVDGFLVPFEQTSLRPVRSIEEAPCVMPSPSIFWRLPDPSRKYYGSVRRWRLESWNNSENAGVVWRGTWSWSSA